MSAPQHVLALDQGTTSTRAIAFDSQAHAVALARRIRKHVRSLLPKAALK